MATTRPPLPGAWLGLLRAALRSSRRCPTEDGRMLMEARTR
jgi:hypothetical protein